MSVLFSTISRRDRLGAAKKLIEVYLVCNDIGYHDSDLNLLAYYCLYGASKGTDIRIRQEYYRRLPERNGKYSVWKTRSKLAKLGLLIRHPYTLELSVNPELLAAFEDTTKLGYLLNFTYEELEANSAATLPGNGNTPENSTAGNGSVLDAHTESAEKPPGSGVPLGGDWSDADQQASDAQVYQLPATTNTQSSGITTDQGEWEEGSRWEF